MEVLLAKPRGFCAGVERAIEIVERALEQSRRADLRAPRDRAQQVRGRGPARQGRGVRRGARRGAGRQHRDLQRARRVARRCAPRPSARPARCSTPPARWSPRCTSKCAKMLRDGYEIVMIGHRGHPEAEGTMGQADDGHAPGRDGRGRRRSSRSRDPAQLAYVTQTTLSVDDAARDRRRAAARASRDPRAEEGRHLLRDAEPPGRGQVHGAAVRRGDRGRLAQQLQLQPPARGGAETAACRPTWSTTPRSSSRSGCEGKRRVGVTAGASAPEILVTDVIARLHELGARACHAASPGRDENVVFALPRELRAP